MTRRLCRRLLHQIVTNHQSRQVQLHRQLKKEKKNEWVFIKPVYIVYVVCRGISKNLATSTYIEVASDDDDICLSHNITMLLHQTSMLRRCLL